MWYFVKILILHFHKNQLLLINTSLIYLVSNIFVVHKGLRGKRKAAYQFVVKWYQYKTFKMDFCWLFHWIDKLALLCKIQLSKIFEK